MIPYLMVVVSSSQDLDSLLLGLWLVDPAAHSRVIAEQPKLFRDLICLVPSKVCPSYKNCSQLGTTS